MAFHLGAFFLGARLGASCSSDAASVAKMVENTGRPTALGTASGTTGAWAGDSASRAQLKLPLTWSAFSWMVRRAADTSTRSSQPPTVSTSPVASALVNPAISLLECGLSVLYGLVVGLVIGYAVIRVDLALTGSRGQGGRRLEEAGAVRPEPPRTAALL